MTKLAKILSTIKSHDGAVLIVTGPSDKFEVHLLQRGTITEAQIERHLPILYHEVMRQRLQDVKLEKEDLPDPDDLEDEFDV